MTPIDLAIAGFYVVGILVLGYVVSRSIHGFRDYFVAGSRMTAPLLVCTIVSTYYGLDVLLGGSEVGYVDGVVGWFWYARPYYLAILLTAYLLARRLRQRDFLSLPDVAAASYGDGTRTVVAVASFFYSLPLIALMGIGVLLDIVLGIPFVWGVILGALVSVAYTLMGGLMADAFTDTIQFTLMCVTLGLAAAFSMQTLGGVEALEEVLPATHFDPRGTYPLPVLVVFSTAALSVFVEPAIYQRIFAAKSRNAILVALGIGIVLWAAYDWVTTVLGMAARAAGVDAEPSYALLTLVVDQLPVGLTGLFVAGVIATGMSTVDSYLLIAGGNLSYDLYRPLVNPSIPDAALLRLTRWGIVVACVVSVAFALFFTSIVSAWVFMAAMLVGAAFVPVVVALFFKRTFKPAAGLASSLTGLVTVTGIYLLVNGFGAEDGAWGTMIWTVKLGGWSFGVWQEYAVLLALPASALAFILGEWLGRKPPAGSEAGPSTGSPVGPPTELRARRAQ
ncbi:MAG: sodium:solute symporter family protein [Longimicrobiales bacterium]|nr:sodium:solute symporter family protein [Longimicrobiales bacterium]